MSTVGSASRRSFRQWRRGSTTRTRSIRSLVHDGTGPEPGLKDPDGSWDLRPHRSRIVDVDDDVLRTWHDVLEDARGATSARPGCSTPSTAPSQRCSTTWPAAAGSAASTWSSRRAGTRRIDRKKGFFESRWGAPDSWDDVILQGPHLFVGTPLYKSPNTTMLQQPGLVGDRLRGVATRRDPGHGVQARRDRDDYDSDYTDWGTDDDPIPARDHYRLAWRRWPPTRANGPSSRH